MKSFTLLSFNSLLLICMIYQEELEKKDVRGRSPLMLAVTLGHLEASKLLMEFGANVNTENKDGWTGNGLRFICYYILVRKYLIFIVLVISDLIVFFKLSHVSEAHFFYNKNKCGWYMYLEVANCFEQDVICLVNKVD